eukprot:gb/GECH01008477.1/.p1 GENE.gb/GECH01008477.1/~~gb/GECH01008477.1/.p1  ORF type:complete len:513 (+),score=117.62 gb/GECH01008477.1/:1-1539(+)
MNRKFSICEALENLLREELGIDVNSEQLIYNEMEYEFLNRGNQQECIQYLAIEMLRKINQYKMNRSKKYSKEFFQKSIYKERNSSLQKNQQPSLNSIAKNILNRLFSETDSLDLSEKAIEKVDDRFHHWFSYLKELRLSNNKLSQLSCLPSTLENLRVSSNQIQTIEISNLKNLRLLSLADNRIDSLQFLTHHYFPQLSVLDLSFNLMEGLTNILNTLNSSCPYLKILWIKGNPCYLEPDYNPLIMEKLPNLTHLDGEKCEKMTDTLNNDIDDNENGENENNRSEGQEEEEELDREEESPAKSSYFSRPFLSLYIDSLTIEDLPDCSFFLSQLQQQQQQENEEEKSDTSKGKRKGKSKGSESPQVKLSYTIEILQPNKQWWSTSISNQDLSDSHIRNSQKNNTDENLTKANQVFDFQEEITIKLHPNQQSVQFLKGPIQVRLQRIKEEILPDATPSVERETIAHGFFSLFPLINGTKNHNYQVILVDHLAEYGEYTSDNAVAHIDMHSKIHK